jgi:hypothetical protein
MMTTLFASQVQPQQSPEEFLQSQSQLFFQHINDVSLGSRVRNIWMQLYRRTGMMIPIFPVQQYTLGEALPNGVIVLDVSVAGDPNVEVTAWAMAHEWGHHALGHTQLQLARLGQFYAAQGSTSHEDDADRYAGRFLRAVGYDLKPVVAFLCALPGGGNGDSHSSGPERAAIVSNAYGAPKTKHVCEERDSSEDEGFDIGIRIWRAISEGVPATMDLKIDGGEAGSLSNLLNQETLDVGPLKKGKHSFTMTNATFYDQFRNVLAYGLECSGYFNVTGNHVFRLRAWLRPSGEVVCGL